MARNVAEQDTPRIRNIDITGFDARFEKYPALNGEHKLDKIGWVAVKWMRGEGF